MKVSYRQGQLSAVGHTLQYGCGFSNFLHCGKKQANQNTNDCNNNEKFDESECVSEVRLMSFEKRHI
jgi:hypothetical protein